MVLCYSNEKPTNTVSILGRLFPEEQKQTIGLLNIPFLFFFKTHEYATSQAKKTNQVADVIKVTNPSNCPGFSWWTLESRNPGKGVRTE